MELTIYSPLFTIRDGKQMPSRSRNSDFARPRTAVDTQWVGFPLQELPDRPNIRDELGQTVESLNCQSVAHMMSSSSLSLPINIIRTSLISHQNATALVIPYYIYHKCIHVCPIPIIQSNSQSKSEMGAQYTALMDKPSFCPSL